MIFKERKVPRHLVIREEYELRKPQRKGTWRLVLIIALVIFVIVKAVNRMQQAQEEAEPTTKDCPFCATAVPIAATRCPHCTSELSTAPAAKPS